MTTSRRGFLGRAAAAVAALAGLKALPAQDDHQAHLDAHAKLLEQTIGEPLRASEIRGTCARCYAHNAILHVVHLPDEACLRWARDDGYLPSPASNRYEDWCTMCVALGPDVQLYRATPTYVSGDGRLTWEAVEQLAERVIPAGGAALLLSPEHWRAFDATLPRSAPPLLGLSLRSAAYETVFHKQRILERMEWLMLPPKNAQFLLRTARRRADLWPYMARGATPADLQLEERRRQMLLNGHWHRGREWLRRT
jgi:hypothetical protein